MSGSSRRKCCCVETELMQWRRCLDGALVDLWSLPYDVNPATGDPLTYPQGMVRFADRKCYYRDGTEPRSTTPGTVITPAGPPNWIGDFVVLPDGFECSGYFCIDHDCVITCDAALTPKVVVLEFSGITPPSGCTECAPAPAGCYGTGTSIDSNYFNDAAVNRAFICVHWGTGDPAECEWQAWAPLTAAARRIVYNETFYSMPGCAEDAGCPGEVIFVDGGDPDPLGVYQHVGVRANPGRFIVTMSQQAGFASPIYLFFGEAPYAAADNCMLSTTANHDPTLGVGDTGQICTGFNRATAGFVRVRPLV